MALKFFNELDIKEPDERDYIRQVILQKFNGDRIEVDDEDLTSDFEVLVGYYIRVKDKNTEETSFISQIKDNLYLYGKDKVLHRPKDLYFYNENLQAYFDDEDGSKFFHLDFYKSAVQKYNEHVVIEFVTKLGVKRTPTVKSVGWPNVRSLPERIRKQISMSNSQEHYIKDYELEGFDDFCQREEIHSSTSFYLWNNVLPKIDFGKYENLTIKFRRKYARTYEESFCISTFKDALKHNRWLFDVKGNLVSAEEITLEDLATEYDRNNGLVQFLGIEKREKSIIELGGTEEQQEQLNLGKLVKSFTNDLTNDEILKALSEASAKKKSCHKETGNQDSEEKAETIDNSTNLQKIENKEPYRYGHASTFGTFPSKTETNDKGLNSQEGKPFQNTMFTREKLRDVSPTEMFVRTSQPSSSEEERKSKILEEDDNVDDIWQMLIEQDEKQNRIKELREKVASSSKYTKEWFDALIELEYKGSAETESGATHNSISIVFNSVRKEEESERIYIFKNPSRCVPMWMEEIEDLEVRCSFCNREDLSLKFEVANVKDNCLRLKASKAYEAILNKIEWQKCTKASITLKNHIDLMGKVHTAFNNLGLEKDFNLKENLKNNIKFIFGPPGTGKTTTLAKRIMSEMGKTKDCKILVLAPTNTACDELARKIIEHSQDDIAWLHRFVSTADESLEGNVVDRDSLVYEDSQCCLISTMARLSFDGFSGNVRLPDIAWDIVICDEASMISLAEICLAIYTFVNTPILIAGDPMQIKPILSEKAWKDENIYTMVKLDRFDVPVTEPIQFDIENLSVQYRSVPAIGELFSQYAYNGKLKHHRTALASPLSFGGINLKPINFIPFKVERYDSVFGIKKLDGSNVHIYSAIFTVEMFKYIIKSYSDVSTGTYSIGIVCPYSPQAQLIESLINQISEIPSNIKVVIGTVHRFQGGQCNLMFVVLNPPMGIKNASDRIFLNNKNILNVAISRAQDSLCVLLPHCDTEGYCNLHEINSIGSIAMKDPNNVAVYTSDKIEEIIFGKKFFIENNTFVTSHQLTNVYTKASKRYEVRIDDKSIDIQLGYDSRDSNLADSENEIKISDSTIIGNRQLNDKTTEEKPVSRTDNGQPIAKPCAETYGSEPSNVEKNSPLEKYISTIDKYCPNRDLLNNLLRKFSPESSFVALQIAGNKEFRQQYGFTEFSETDITYAFERIKDKFTKETYKSWFLHAYKQSRCSFKKMTPLSAVSLEEYRIILTKRKNKPKKNKTHKSKIDSSLANTSRNESDNTTLYETFEYGLSDW